MKEIGIMEPGEAAAVIKERRDHIAVAVSIRDANTITPKQQTAIIWKADPYMRKLITADAMLMNTGMTTWSTSQGICMENLEADTRIIVASPLVEVEEAVIKANIGVTTTCHIVVHMGYEHLLNI